MVPWARLSWPWSNSVRALELDEDKKATMVAIYSSSFARDDTTLSSIPVLSVRVAALKNIENYGETLDKKKSCGPDRPA